jgi:hypothetical protein
MAFFTRPEHPVGLCAARHSYERTMTMNDVTNKEIQFEEAGKRRIVIDGSPYTVKVFFQPDTKETGMGKIMQQAKKDITANPMPE